jgi:hypothetical protein
MLSKNPIFAWRFRLGRFCSHLMVGLRPSQAIPSYRCGALEPGECPMKKLFVIVALGTVIAAPAFAQREPNTDHSVRSPQQQRSTVPPGRIYYERNGNANPDF